MKKRKEMMIEIDIKAKRYCNECQFFIQGCCALFLDKYFDWTALKKEGDFLRCDDCLETFKGD